MLSMLRKAIIFVFLFFTESSGRTSLFAVMSTVYIYIEISVYICIYTVHHLRHHAKVTLSHFEAVLDSFYFIGNSMKDVLNLYTKVAGRPMLPPLWGLFLGDSDCYNNARHKMTTSTALLLGVRRLSLATIHEIKSVRH